MFKRLTTVALLASTVALAADSAGGVSWEAPKEWKAEGQRPMRVATYTVPAAKGDNEGAELAVFFFGKEGGSIDANVTRWSGQFDGAPKPETKTEKMAGFEVTTVELAGTYQQSMGGPMGPKTPKAGYKLYGAIVAAPEGNVFFKLTGPAKTVDGSKAAMKKMLGAMRKP